MSRSKLHNLRAYPLDLSTKQYTFRNWFRCLRLAFANSSHHQYLTTYAKSRMVLVTALEAPVNISKYTLPQFGGYGNNLGDYRLIIERVCADFFYVDGFLYVFGFPDA